MTEIPTPVPGDLIRANPTQIAKGQVKADTSRWPNIDTISVSNNRDKALTEPFIAEVTNNSNGNIKANKVNPEGDRTILPDDEIDISVDTIIENNIPVAEVSAASNINYVCPLSSRTPGASLKVRIIQISNSIAYADVLSEREPGIDLGDRVGVQLTRGNLRATFGPSQLRSFNCVLNREPIVSGSGVARISAYSNDGIECMLKETTNEIQVGDRYQMDVARGSTKAQPPWPESVGISSVQLEQSAASTTALVELTEVRESVSGRIIEYQNLPPLGSTHRVRLERKQDSVHIDGIPVQFDSKSKVSGEGTIEIKKEGVPSEGTITEYHGLPSIHTTVTVTLEQDQDFVLLDGVPIELESPSEITGEVSLEITSDNLPRK
jgi:hypothetical protein